MKATVANYVQDVAHKYARETSTEYSYRTEFEQFLRHVFEKMGVTAIDHDAKSRDGNKPDFVIIKGQVPILYIETKDIGVSLDKIENSEQMARYFGYANLVLTDYLEFRFYRNGIPYGEPITLADFDKKTRTILPHEDKFEQLFRRLLDFTKSHKEPIKNGEHLAKIMGGKAQRLRDNVREYLKDDSASSNETIKVYKTIKRLLVHDLDLEQFADMYAQTIVYGLFVARFHDESPDNFTRQEARDLIPNSNPFLRHFFDHIVGPNFDKRLEFIVDELCHVFSHSDVEKLMNDFYKKSSKSKTTHDPVIHFYEDFLKEYDPDLRKRMGAYYTPTPVVRFMTRSVDYLLKKEFGLRGGLADTTKLKDGKTHRVQVLDPAVGTGTFISAVIREIYLTFKGQEGRWPKYVHNDLLPRIHGFELMMAPYTISHLKLAMAFKETGFKYFNRRLGIYLTNSLEKADEQEGLFTSFGLADSIAHESKEAQEIKNNKPIMVVIGNPPYSGISQNKGEWITNLIEDYKYIDGEHFGEKKHWLNDDYVKFIRFAEQFIEKNELGIIAYITPHGFLDNPTFRGMRWHLMKTFNKIYTIDLHGNTKKRETAPDGSKDENVFNIQQGVAITLFIKEGGDQNKLSDVYHADLYGKRSEKFKQLDKSHIGKIDYEKLDPVDPFYSFVPSNWNNKEAYESGFKVDDLFIEKTSGIQTSRDFLVVDSKRKKLEKRMERFLDINKSVDQIRTEFFSSSRGTKYPKGDTRGWKVDEIRPKLQKLDFRDFITKISYRPFDIQYICYTDLLVDWGREKVMNHMLRDNISMTVGRQGMATGDNQWDLIFAQEHISDLNLFYRGGGVVCPLYLYADDGTIQPNLNSNIIKKIEDIVGKVSPEEVFDYIYAVLFSRLYRKKYEEFLNVDFPRVPYPNSKEYFLEMTGLGLKLRAIHLLHDSRVNSFITTYPKLGTDVVELSPKLDNGKVYINSEQYFGEVPENTWEFTIGGYQPAQKWLKDRKGTTLSNEDIEHYQRIIVALVETQKLMEQIDKVIEL